MYLRLTCKVIGIEEMYILQGIVSMVVMLLVIAQPVSTTSNNRPITDSSSGHVIVCYFTNWAQYRSGLGRYRIEHVDPYLCTDIVYAFANIDTALPGLAALEWNDEELYTDLVGLKYINPGLKVHLAVGGFSAGTLPFERITSSVSTMERFAVNSAIFLRARGFDGLDLDWEFPGSAYKSRFTDLCRVLSQHFQQEALSSGASRLKLTAAVSGYKVQIEASYEPHLIHQYLDHISVMAYDYFGTWSSVLGHNSPLYVRSEDRTGATASLLSQNASMTWWHELGVPKNKLVMGVATYGRTFRMAASDLWHPGDLFAGSGGDVGTYTGTPGFMAYYEVCSLLTGAGSWTRVWINDSKVPFAYGQRNSHWEWLAYDDVQSMREKAAYIVQEGLAGAMFWTLDFDDFTHDVCEQGPYPLINEMKTSLNNSVQENQTSSTNDPRMTVSTAIVDITSVSPLDTSSTSSSPMKDTASSDSSGGRVIACHFTNWAQFRSGLGTYLTEHVDPYLCTDIVYAFAKIDTALPGLATVEWNDEDLYADLVALKNVNPDLKVHLAVGGSSVGTRPFESITLSISTMERFAVNSATFLRARGFDGLDLDWEFPGSVYKSRFTDLCRVLSQHFQQEALSSGASRLKLTAAVSGYKVQIEASYEPHLIHQYLDHISVMAYDYFGTWSSVLGHNSPLYVRSEDRTDATASLLSQNASMTWWHELGVPKNKLVMGAATYGRTFRMASSDLWHPGDRSVGTGGGDVGTYTGTPGFMAYYEICSLLVGAGSWTRVWMDDAKVPFAYGQRNSHWEWLAYDDVQSMREKAAYIAEEGLAGAMFWTLDFDDFIHNVCGQGPYPLINEMKTSLSNSVLENQTSSTNDPEMTASTAIVDITSLSPLDTSSTSSSPMTDTDSSDSNNGHVIACYFTNWAQYRSGLGTYRTEHVDPYLCTDIVYAFAKIDTALPGLATVEWNDEELYADLVALKDINPDLKVHLAVGGASAGSSPFESITSSVSTMESFAVNSAIFLRARGFDGLDLDWEFPSSAYKSRFTDLCRVLSQHFQQESLSSGASRLKLTAAVSGYKVQIEASYEPHLIHQYLDHISVMAYDYFGTWSSVLGHNSPLYVRSEDRTDATASLLSQNASMTWWHELGVPKNKLVMGAATYGRTFRMAGSDLWHPGDLFTGSGGDAGTYTGTQGFMAYYEVCSLLTGAGSWTRVWMDGSKVPFAYGQRNSHWEWLAYDDVQSMREKAAYIVEEGLAGAMFWTLDFDDFIHDVCGQGPYPLINEMKTGLYNLVQDNQSSSTNDPRMTSSTAIGDITFVSPLDTSSTTSSATTPDASSDSNNGHVIACYFTNWAQYRSGLGKYLTEHVDPNLCTDIVYAFANIDTALPGLATVEWNDEDLYADLVALKDINPDLKVHLAVGGASAGTSPFESITSSVSTMESFAVNSATFLRARGFDGLDLDWEFPGSAYKSRFTDLCRVLSQHFQQEALSSGASRLKLSAAVSGYKVQIEASYEPHLIHQYLDHISVMAYDYFGTWSSVLGHNSPLYVRSEDRTDATASLLSQNASMTWWHELGVPKNKLVMGVATYGRTFRMAASDLWHLGDRSVGTGGDVGTYSGTAGFMAYYEVCSLLARSRNWTRVWIDDSNVPFAYGQRNSHWEWLAYDDVHSMREKAAYIVEEGLAGAMFWTLDFDDFNYGVCGQGPYPLINEMKTGLSNSAQENQAPSTNDPRMTAPTTAASSDSSSEHVIACYFTNWAQNRSGLDRYLTEHVDPYLCTDIVYAFANIDTALPGLAAVEWTNEDLHADLVALKDINPDLKVHLAVGGASAGTLPFESITSSVSTMGRFAVNSAIFLRTLGFDGLDLDWEFPGSAYKSRFTDLCRVLSQHFQQEALSSGASRLKLSAAVSGYKVQIEASYEPHLIHQYLDHISVMAYDYFGTWSSVLGHNSPLYVRSEDRTDATASLLSQNASMTWWHELGVPKNKLVMGVATYGRTFRMASSDLWHPGDVFAGTGGDVGAYTGTPGFMAYYEVCSLLAGAGNWTRVWIDDSKVPFAYGQRNSHWEWLAYDDVQSMREKAAYIVEEGLAGAMLWTLDFDDFIHDVCGQGAYPLISEMKTGLSNFVPERRTSDTHLSSTADLRASILMTMVAGVLQFLLFSFISSSRAV